MENKGFFYYLKQQTIIKKDQIFYSRTTRSNFKNTIFIIIFILISFLLSFTFASVTGGYDFGFLFRSMFSVGVLYKEWISFAAILGVSGLSFLFAYRSGLFNIGISGQMLGAGLALVGLSKSLTSSSILNSPAAVLLSVIVVILTGAFIALISGLLKNFFNINEVVSTIMINWIIFYLAKYFIVGTEGFGAGDLAGNNGNSLSIHENLSLYDPSMNSGYVASIIIFVILIVLIWITFKFTAYGKKIIAVGKSKSAGIYSGYNTRLLQLSTFVISGGIAGLLALIVYTGQSSSTFISSNLTFGNMLPVEGFNGIAISLVSFSNPIITFPISFLFSMVQASVDFPTGLSSLVLSLTMYSIAIFTVIYTLKPIAFIKKKLALKKEYDDSYFVHQQDECTKQYLNDIRKQLASREIDLFLAKKDENNNTLSFKAYINKKIQINEQYLINTSKIKMDHTPWYKAFNKKIDLNQEGAQ